jgi:asparagine synthase (glutamine-hydrolysing)
VAPGTCVAVDREGRDERIPYYAFPRFVEPDLKGEDAMAAFDEALTKAVRRHLVSDVPVGCFLSGGVDSPLVAAKTAALAGPVPAFTIGTGGELDESADAATYATSLHLGHTVEHLTQPAAVKLIGDFVAACGEPFADVSILPTLFLSELAARHVKVVLSGDGGDELFWGYAGRFIAALERFEQFQQNRWIRRARWAARHVLHPGRADAGFFGTLGEWYRNKHTRLRAPWLKRVFPDIAAWPEQCDGFDYRVLNRDEAAQWLRWNEFVIHLPMVLQKVDRASMFHSLEVRVPFLDREVIDVATRIRWSDCLDVQRGIGKIPLRRSLERHLKFQTIRKRGFGIDINQWIAGPLRGAVEEHVLTRRDLLGLPVRRGALQRMFREHCEGAGRHGPALWTILALCLWCDRHGHPVVPGVRQAARMPAREAVAVSP